MDLSGGALLFVCVVFFFFLNIVDLQCHVNFRYVTK